MSGAEVAKIAKGLTKAQVAAIMSATVMPPHSTFMPHYHAVKVPGFCSNSAVAELEEIGFWALPIRTGNYGHTVEWRGEMLPLGLAVRQYLQETPHD